MVAADVCLCEYTSHGHCGVLKDGSVDNDATLPLLAKAAVEYAGAGADIVCPSAMMDVQVAGNRRALDESELEERLVMGYSAKFASSFYGPFREAAGSAPAFGDRKAYQMSPANSREAMREIEADVREGADISHGQARARLPRHHSKARSRFDLPIAAYSVSGEYSMIKAAADERLDRREGQHAMEVLTSIKRAGADVIITYFAEQAAGLAQGGA